jgi:membrane protein YdbS with pleckstrin-like domain
MNGGLMFAQIATSFGPFQAQKGMLQVTIISAGQREKIQAILKI